MWLCPDTCNACRDPKDDTEVRVQQHSVPLAETEEFVPARSDQDASSHLGDDSMQQASTSMTSIQPASTGALTNQAHNDAPETPLARASDSVTSFYAGQSEGTVEQGSSKGLIGCPSKPSQADTQYGSLVPGTGDEVPGVPHGCSGLSSAEWQQAEDKALQDLARKGDAPFVWIKESLVRWRELPLGEGCDGKAFLQAAESIPSVYPWIFHMSYAVKYLTKEYNDHLGMVRAKWPPGARSLREAVRAEVKSLGGQAVVCKKYWNTLTVRLLWITRTMRMFDVIMEALVLTEETPIDCGRKAIEDILGDSLNWTLKKIAGYIVGFCAYKNQDVLFENLKVNKADFKSYLKFLYPLLRRQADSLEKMLDEEVPEVVKKKAV